MQYELDPKNLPPEVKEVARLAFPDYRGKKFALRTQESVNCRSYWDGGSRNYYAWVALATKEVLAMPTSHPVYDKVSASVENLPVLPGFVCVEHCIFCGTDMGLTFIVHPSTNLLPPPKVAVDADEYRVLEMMYTTISSYGGLNRQVRSGMALGPWNAALERLKGKGLVNKGNALTVAGKNTFTQLRTEQRGW